jgi:tRNA/rRNA methyltransferase
VNITKRNNLHCASTNNPGLWLGKSRASPRPLGISVDYNLNYRIMPLDHFAFVLVRPKSPANIGAAARALKNMGVRDLRIVSQNDGERLKDRRAAALAVHGSDVLASATMHPDLTSALTGCTLVVGTTARTGLYRSEARSIREVADDLAASSYGNRVGVVFGPEDFGLTNEDLKFCQRLVTIPTASDYPSLNLAQAVMIVAYELMLATGGGRNLARVQQSAPAIEVDAMLGRLARALMAIGFLLDDNPDHLMFAIRTIVGRAGLTPRELDIMNGIASQILWFAEGGHETIAAKQRAGKKLR